MAQGKKFALVFALALCWWTEQFCRLFKKLLDKERNARMLRSSMLLYVSFGLGLSLVLAGWEKGHRWVSGSGRPYQMPRFTSSHEIWMDEGLKRLEQ